MSIKTERKPLFIFHPACPPHSPVMLCNADRRMSPCWLLIGRSYAFVCVRACRAQEMWRVCTCATVHGSIDRHLQAPLGCTEALIASIFPSRAENLPQSDRTALPQSSEAWTRVSDQTSTLSVSPQSSYLLNLSCDLETLYLSSKWNFLEGLSAEMQ